MRNMEKLQVFFKVTVKLAKIEYSCSLLRKIMLKSIQFLFTLHFMNFLNKSENFLKNVYKKHLIFTHI